MTPIERTHRRPVPRLVVVAAGVDGGASPSPVALLASRSAPGLCRERLEGLEAVHDAVSAALTGDMALCRLRQQRAWSLCFGRPHVAWAACRQILRALHDEVIARHLRGCDRRRALGRELEALAVRLREVAAPAR